MPITLHKKDDFPDSNCGGIVLFSYDKSKVVLVSSMKGHKSFPKGKREKKDRSFDDTAFRETEEETGICSDQITILSDDVICEFKEGKSNVSVAYLVGTMNTPHYGKFTYDEEELIDVKWYDIDEALRLDTLADRRKEVLDAAIKIMQN